MVVGDYNARIGADDAKYTFHDATNRNGKYILDLALEKNLIIANTRIQKRTGKLWTNCQLDYVLVRKKWKNSLLNAKYTTPFPA